MLDSFFERCCYEISSDSRDEWKYIGRYTEVLTYDFVYDETEGEESDMQKYSMAKKSSDEYRAETRDSPDYTCEKGEYRDDSTDLV